MHIYISCMYVYLQACMHVRMCICCVVHIYVILLTVYVHDIYQAPSSGSHKYCKCMGVYVCTHVCWSACTQVLRTYAIKAKTVTCVTAGCHLLQAARLNSGEMLDDGDIRPPLEPNVFITVLNTSRRRARDLPSQLLHQLCVVGRKELDHEAEDGVLGPCGGSERGRDLNRKCRCFK